MVDATSQKLRSIYAQVHNQVELAAIKETEPDYQDRLYYFPDMDQIILVNDTIEGHKKISEAGGKCFAVFCEDYPEKLSDYVADMITIQFYLYQKKAASTQQWPEPVLLFMADDDDYRSRTVNGNKILFI